MSLLFSNVTITPKVGLVVTVNESGHPDEYDIRDLIRCELRYAPVRDTAYLVSDVSVRQYRFRTGGRDWLAERDSFALMAAYDALAQRHGEKPFVQREDVELVGQYAFWLQLCDFCGHRELLTPDDVAACACCDMGEYFEPDIREETETA